jgi:hypothetical protein
VGGEEGTAAVEMEVVGWGIYTFIHRKRVGRRRARVVWWW